MLYGVYKFKNIIVYNGIFCGVFVMGMCGEVSGVLLYGGEEMGVINLLVVVRVKKSLSFFIVSLLCRVFRGWRFGIMLNFLKVEIVYKIWLVYINLYLRVCWLSC